jgi:malate synthase
VLNKDFCHVIETMKRMTVIMDLQNVKDVNYINMAPTFIEVAFSAACDLVIKRRS